MSCWASVSSFKQSKLYAALVWYWVLSDGLNNDIAANAEPLICKLYKLSRACSAIQAVQKSVLCKMKNIEFMPPTKYALDLHLMRAHHQAFIWRRALHPCPTWPISESCGWELTASQLLKSVLMTKDLVSAKSLEISSYGCLIGGQECSTRQCQCTGLNLPSKINICPCTDYCRNPLNHDWLTMNRLSHWLKVLFLNTLIQCGWKIVWIPCWIMTIQLYCSNDTRHW